MSNDWGKTTLTQFGFIKKKKKKSSQNVSYILDRFTNLPFVTNFSTLYKSFNILDLQDSDDLGSRFSDSSFALTKVNFNTDNHTTSFPHLLLYPVKLSLLVAPLTVQLSHPKQHDLKCIFLKSTQLFNLEHFSKHVLFLNKNHPSQIIKLCFSHQNTRTTQISCNHPSILLTYVSFKHIQTEIKVLRHYQQRAYLFSLSLH